MKWITLVGIIAVAIVTATTSAIADQKKEETKTEFANITVEQLQAAIKDGKVAIIDVNSVKSYNEAHIPGAMHFKTLKKEELKKALPEDKATLVVAYCGGPQ